MLLINNNPGLFEGLIPLAIGIYMSLAALGIVPVSFDSKKSAAWRKQWAPKLRFGGPLLMIVGLVQLARFLLK